MTDLYAFTKPGDAGKSILVLNVHPSVAVNPPGPTTKEPFAPGALYEFKIDTDGDAIADIAYSVQFSSSKDGKQTATLRRIQGERAAGVCDDGEVIVKEAPVSVGREAVVTTAGDCRCFFGWRSDPFFFDANGFFNKMQFTGDDFFAAKDVCSIALEVPNSALGTNVVGLWARTLDKTGEGWIQADRGGRPMQAVFLPGEEREAYLNGEPADADRFIGVFAHELERSGGYTSEDAVGVARKLLPDILSYDPRRPTRFPDDGRTLTDDVVDGFFSMLTNGKVTGDMLATGAEPIRLDVPGANRAHVHTLRSLADSRAIIDAAKRAKRAVVIGGSFIGLEVAASLRARNLEVHVVAPESLPLGRILGEHLGTFIKSLHESKGVVFHLGRKPARIDADSVTLDDGSRLEADLVVMGVGVRPRLALAEGAGLAMDRGVSVNEFLETSVPGIFAAGDIARWPDPHTGDRIRVEHWVLAQRHGQTAARNILGAREAFTQAPFFWSAHYDVSINYVGHAEKWDRVDVDGDAGEHDVTVRFMRGDKALAVATIFRDKESGSSGFSVGRGRASRSGSRSRS